MGNPQAQRAVIYFTNSNNGFVIQEAVVGRFFPKPHRWLAMVGYPDFNTLGWQEQVMGLKLIGAGRYA